MGGHGGAQAFLAEQFLVRSLDLEQPVGVQDDQVLRLQPGTFASVGLSRHHPERHGGRVRRDRQGGQLVIAAP